MMTRIEKSTEYELTKDEWRFWYDSFDHRSRMKFDGIDYFGVYKNEDDNFIDKVFCGVGANGVPMSAVLRLDKKAESKRWMLYIVKTKEV